MVSSKAVHAAANRQNVFEFESKHLCPTLKIGTRKVRAKPSPKEFNEKFDQDRAEFLRKLVCEDARNGKAVAQGIIRNWIDDTNPLISENHERREFSTRLAFLLSGTECQPMKQLGEKTKEILDRAKTKKTPYRAAKLGAPSYLEQRMNPSTCLD